MSALSSHESHLAVPLTQLKCGQMAFVFRIDESHPQKEFLSELGFTKEAPLCILRTAPFGDPLHVRIRNSEFALLKSDAKHIWVKAFE